MNQTPKGLSEEDVRMLHVFSHAGTHESLSRALTLVTRVQARLFRAFQGRQKHRHLRLRGHTVTVRHLSPEFTSSNVPLL